MQKLHQLIRKDQNNTKSERIKILCLCSTCLITILNIFSIILLQITPKVNDTDTKEWNSNFHRDYQILSKGSGIYLSTIILVLILTKYSYQSIMFKITKNEYYTRRKFLLLTIANNFTACIQSTYIFIILFNSSKFNSGIFESKNISTKLILAFTFISTFYSILVAILLWRKLLLNDEKITLIHRDRDSIKRKDSEINQSV